MSDQVVHLPEPAPRFIGHTVTGGLTAVGLLAAIYTAFAIPAEALPLQAKV